MKITNIKGVESFFDSPVIKDMIREDFNRFVKESYQKLNERTKRRILYKMFGKEFRDTIVEMNKKKK